MANQIITMTLREKWALEGKSKQGWKCYFIERDLMLNLGANREEQRPIVENLRLGNAVDTTHLTRMFLELYDKVGELCECPICFDVMIKDNIHLALCGHMICKTCKLNPALNIISCPVCRKNY